MKELEYFGVCDKPKRDKKSKNATWMPPLPRPTSAATYSLSAGITKPKPKTLIRSNLEKESTRKSPLIQPAIRPIPPPPIKTGLRGIKTKQPVDAWMTPKPSPIRLEQKMMTRIPPTGHSLPLKRPSRIRQTTTFK